MTLPNFIIGGAMKAGTTSLRSYLRQHPQIYMSPIKEARFFAYDPTDPLYVGQDNRTFPIRTMDEYLALFDRVKDELAIGEATPLYLTSELAPINIKETIPDIRLIFSLRHPVDRVYSLYLMRAVAGFPEGDVYDICRPGGDFVDRARYSPHFKHWLKYFDLAQMHIIRLDDLQDTPLEALQSIFRFLGVEPGFEPDTSKQYNVGGVPKNRVASNVLRGLKALRNQALFTKLKPYVPEYVRANKPQFRMATLEKADVMPEDLANDLTEYFRDDVLELQDILGVDLSIWKIA